MEYRKEIDGLRAVAVLPVVFFHAGVGGFSGGYVGVDIFFVISGYLITSLILSESSRGTFRFSEFYERRVRRILPALFFVISACIPLSFILMTPAQLESFSRSIVSSVFFSSNFHFFIEDGYFASASETKPLLHTWSLSIEEQFYILFPAALLMLISFSGKALPWIIAFVAFLSLIFAQWSGNLIGEPPFIENNLRWFDQSFLASYYMPFGRAWELLSGALLAIYLSRSREYSKPVQNVGSLLGFSLLCCSIFLFDKNTPFPSFYTLIPVIGTMLIIWFARPDTFIGKMLSSKLFVGVGLISYSLYLWHQPILAYVRLISPDWLESHATYTVLASCLLISFVSWKYVEAPFRDRKRVSKRVLILGLSSITAVNITYATMAITSEGFISRYPLEDQKLLAMNEKEMASYTPKYFKEYRLQDFDEGKYKLFLIGDSFAMDFLNMGMESGHFSNVSISTHHIERQCGIVFSEKAIAENVAADDKVYCDRRGRFEASTVKLLLNQADMVILASRWSDWVSDNLEDTLENLKLLGAKKVVILGSKNFGKFDVRTFLDTSLDYKINFKNTTDSREVSIIKSMATELRDDEFVDVQMMICGSYLKCPLFTTEGELVTLDGSHLTQQGARYFGNAVFESELLKPLN
ncbi:acyltransferase [Paraneptunicella aestuarii]|uniref:acyltransferase family protein n=1 Tax=Paraneptunicella aestuarii TaxID=2831148 RepID=UPI001E2BBB86|nr:acyltransferase family protein [Paraneptunicella aestuarii]UAA39142.1 acyltransferase [Paraneptunicella aestuarii]